MSLRVNFLGCPPRRQLSPWRHGLRRVLQLPLQCLQRRRLQLQLFPPICTQIIDILQCRQSGQCNILPDNQERVHIRCTGEL